MFHVISRWWHPPPAGGIQCPNRQGEEEREGEGTGNVALYADAWIQGHQVQSPMHSAI